ncbi:MAG: acyltransferase, partial [Proteobacteria bacterium]
MIRRMSKSSRLIFLDSLRGIAAIAVMVEHIGVSQLEIVKRISSEYFQFGQFGVSLFFLCSGFVIPFSLERTKDLGAFWISRVFRLYPLYWAALGALLALYGLSVVTLPERFTEALPLSAIANITMIQAFLGFEHASSVFWSLGYEMIFYILVSIAFVVGILRRTSLFVLGFCCLCIINPVITRFILHKAPHLGVTFHFTTMFFGTLVYRWYAGEITGRSFKLFYAFLFLTILLVNGFGLYGHETSDVSGVKTFLPMTSAWVGAYSLFGLFLAAREFRYSGFAKRAGTISYSLYLIHPIVIAIGISTGNARLNFV